MKTPVLKANGEGGDKRVTRDSLNNMPFASNHRQDKFCFDGMTRGLVGLCRFLSLVEFYQV